ncbi:ABC transporter ATP-binding protein/permease, partial [Alphaproteobacteria bacterium]|nr:ABC transporter ATP-binding protein/permease [Alphaproteobacteria bacterium]
MFKKLNEILNNLNKNYFKKILIIFILMFTGMVMEALSITLIIPFMSIFLAGEYYPQFEFLNKFIFFDLNFKSLSIILIIVFLAKNLFLTFLNYYKARFTFTLQADISSTLFKKYLHTSYLNFSGLNATKIIRNITQESNILAIGFITPILIVITEIFLASGVILILIIFNSKLFFVMLLVAFLILGIFFFSIRKAIDLLGKKRQFYEGERFKIIGNAINSFKITKIFNKENYYLDTFFNKSKPIIKSGTLNETFSQLPKAILEVLMIFLFLFSIFVLSKDSNTSVNDIIVTLSIFGYGFIRIFPSLNRIMVSLQGIQFAHSTLELIHKESKDVIVKKPSLLKIKFNNKIELKNIDFKYGENSIFQNISFNITKNSIIGITGSSGVGKTTFIDIISGLLTPDSGEIFVDGRLIPNKKLSSLTQMFAHVTQDNYLIDDDFIGNIAIGVPRDKVDTNKLNKVIKTSLLDDFINNNKNGLYEIIGDKGSKLSGGQAQRVGIARALYFDRKILILDEPTSALDMKNEFKLINNISKLKNGITIIIISHKESTLKMCKHIYKITSSKILK